MSPAPNSKHVADYLALDDDALFAQCRVDTFRVSGPGGQHRNRTDTAVRLTHAPSGVTAQASERRSQLQNRKRALRRLRVAIAHDVRRPLDLDGYAPPAELRAVLAAATAKRLGPRHADYPRGVQAFLDLFVAVDAVVSEAARRAGVSTGALSRFIQADPPLMVCCNALRDERGLRPLRGR